jgi:uncharacterized protein
MIYYISSNLKKFFIKNNISYIFSVVTNGYLLERKVKSKLVRSHVTLAQITVDGIREIHNNRRPLINGEGTFDTIIENIKLKSKMDIYLNIVYDDENIDHIYELIDYLVDNKLTEKIYKITPNHTIPYNKNGELYDFNISKKNEAQEKLKIIEYLLRKNFKVSFSLNHKMCSLVQKGSFIVIPGGEIYKCISGVCDRDFFVCEMNTYSDPFEKQYRLMMNKTDEECINCKYYPICINNCLYENKLRNRKVCNRIFWDEFLPKYLLLINNKNYKNNIIYSDFDKKWVEQKYF